MPRALLVVSIASLALGCGRDVFLGGSVDGGIDASDAEIAPDAADDASSDAGPDTGHVSLTPFPDGTYDMTVSPTSEIVCMSTWAGMESAFSGVTLATLGIVDGPVELLGVDAAHVEVSGAPIETSFMTTPVSLESGGGPGVPMTIWIGIGTTPPVGGPLGSTLIGLDLEADETTLTASGFDGRISAWYVDIAADGTQCLVGFPTHFDRL